LAIPPTIRAAAAFKTTSERASSRRRLANTSRMIFALSFAPLLSQELLDRVYESFTDVETVSIKGAFCQTDIVTGSDVGVRLEGEIRSVRRYQDLRIRFAQTGSQLDIWIEQPRNATGQIRGWLLLTVPVQTRVEVSNLSGSINVDGLGSDTTNLETLSGNVDAQNITGPLKVKTASGNIHGTLLGGHVSAQAVSGNIRMKEVIGQLDLTTISGNIKGLQVMLTGPSTFRNSSGNIDMVFDNDAETLSFNLKTVSGLIDVYGLSAEKQLIKGEGPFRVTGATTSGNQSYK